MFATMRRANLGRVMNGGGAENGTEREREGQERWQQCRQAGKANCDWFVYLYNSSQAQLETSTHTHAHPHSGMCVCVRVGYKYTQFLLWLWSRGVVWLWRFRFSLYWFKKMKNLCLNKSAARERGRERTKQWQEAGEGSSGTLGWRWGAVAIGATT